MAVQKQANNYAVYFILLLHTVSFCFTLPVTDLFIHLVPCPSKRIQNNHEWKVHASASHLKTAGDRKIDHRSHWISMRAVAIVVFVDLVGLPILFNFLV